MSSRGVGTVTSTSHWPARGYIWEGGASLLEESEVSSPPASAKSLEPRDSFQRPQLGGRHIVETVHLRAVKDGVCASDS